MSDNANMYKSSYEPIEGLPLTLTIPMLLEWKGVSPYKIEEETKGDIKQVTIHRICTGYTKDPKKPIVEKLAGYFGVSFHALYDVDAIRSIVEGDEHPQEVDDFLHTMRQRLLAANKADREQLMSALLVLSKGNHQER
jgi:hypothetical protein